MLNALFVNFCILCTSTLLVNWTLRSLSQAWTPVQIGLRAVLTILSAFALVANAVPLAGGVSLDLRAVPVALAALGGGWPAGLCVALPLAVHSVWQGGPRGLAVALSLAVVVALTAALRPRGVDMRDNTGVLPWQPALIFGASNLPLVLGAWLTSGRGPDALGLAALLTAVQGVGMLASQAITLTQLRALEQGEAMQTLAYTDPLTALGNRRALDEALGGATPDAHLLLFDLDHFKRVNDQHGHGAGDGVLRATAEVLRGVLGERAQVYRHGGEEFSALVCAASDPEARDLAEAVRAGIAAQVGRRCGLGHPVTMSVGVARVGHDAAAARIRADHALYAAKRAGRDRVVQAG